MAVYAIYIYFSIWLDFLFHSIMIKVSEGTQAPSFFKGVLFFRAQRPLCLSVSCVNVTKVNWNMRALTDVQRSAAWLFLAPFFSGNSATSTHFYLLCFHATEDEFGLRGRAAVSFRYLFICPHKNMPETAYAYYSKYVNHKLVQSPTS